LNQIKTCTGIDEDFFRALSDHPVPVSEMAVRAIGPRVAPLLAWCTPVPIQHSVDERSERTQLRLASVPPTIAKI
jgi:hypothetical protein